MGIHRLVTTTVLILSASGVADAQQVRLGIQVGRLADPTASGQTGLTVLPEAIWAGARHGFRIGGVGAVLQNGARIGGGFMGGETEVWRAGPVRTVLRGDAAASGGSGLLVAAGSVSPRIRVGHARLAAEAGPLARWGGDRRANSPGGGGRDPLGLGGSPASDPLLAGSGFIVRRSQGVSGAVHATGRRIGVTAGWSRQKLASGAAWTDWSAGGAVDLRGAVVNVAVGQRVGGQEPETWASARIAAGLSRALSLVGEVGRFPSDPLTDRGPGRFAAVGMSIAVRGARGGSPRPVGLLDVGPGPVRLEIRARPGARVELVGDWNEWRPEAVGERSPGQFAAEMRLAPGTYRFGFLVDGQWRLPRGHATEADEYGGRRALFRVTAETGSR